MGVNNYCQSKDAFLLDTIGTSRRKEKNKVLVAPKFKHTNILVLISHVSKSEICMTAQVNLEFLYFIKTGTNLSGANMSSFYEESLPDSAQ